jgi:6-pyruvoyltetrahydropterin/6-carboxytetrahydropterin synthase
MIFDFSQISSLIKNKMDHKHLNDVFDFNPTAENIAYWICNQFEQCYRCDVAETEGSIASYKKEEK